MPYKSKKRNLSKKTKKPKSKVKRSKVKTINQKSKKGGANNNNNNNNIPEWLRIIGELSNKIDNYQYNNKLVNKLNIIEQTQNNTTKPIDLFYVKAVNLSNLLMNYEKDCEGLDEKKDFCNQLSDIMNKCNFIKSDRIKCEQIIVLLKNPIINIYLKLAALNKNEITISVLQDKVMELAINFFGKFTMDDDITKQLLQLNIFYKQLNVGQILEDQNIDIKEVFERNENINKLGIPSDKITNFVNGDITILTNQEDNLLMLNENVNSIKTEVDNHEINVREELNAYFDKYLNISIQKGGVNTRIFNKYKNAIKHARDLRSDTVVSSGFVIGGAIALALSKFTAGITLFIIGALAIESYLLQVLRIKNKKKLMEIHFEFSVIEKLIRFLGKTVKEIKDKKNNKLAIMNKDKEFIVINTERYKTLIPFIVIFNLITDKLIIQTDKKEEIKKFMENKFNDVFVLYEEEQGHISYKKKNDKNKDNYYEHKLAAKLLSMFTDSQMSDLFINSKTVFKFKKLIDPTTVILRYKKFRGLKYSFELSKKYNEYKKTTIGTIGTISNIDNKMLNIIKNNLTNYKEILGIDEIQINPKTSQAPDYT